MFSFLFNGVWGNYKTNSSVINTLMTQKLQKFKKKKKKKKIKKKKKKKKIMNL